MITHIHIQNYRSFIDAAVDLQPFSLVIGANGAGKSNLLGAVKYVFFHQGTVPIWHTHASHPNEIGSIIVGLDGGNQRSVRNAPGNGRSTWDGWSFGQIQFDVFNLDPRMIAGTESISTEAKVGADGNGTAQVLESLKNGDREDLFDKIEANFKLYVPEVEKLSLRTVEKGKKQIQVRERGLGGHVLPATELSDGTRLILCILTIIHQEKPPPVILLEDIDRGMHPRIFEQMVPLMKDIAKQHDINIIATTHNPFLVDCFEDDPEAVIIVEKKDGASTLSTLKSRMEGLDYDTANPDEMPLGNLWYSGLVGGVPLPGRRRNRREA
jgi:predicted ATPase